MPIMNWRRESTKPVTGTSARRRTSAIASRIAGESKTNQSAALADDFDEARAIRYGVAKSCCSSFWMVLCRVGRVALLNEAGQ